MSINLAGAAEATLTVFSGLVSEMSPSDLPDGASPALSDCVFAPGNVSSRAGLSKVFASPFPNNATVTYAKSYVTPTGDIENLYLDSNGILWWEDLTNSPGTYSQIATTKPGSYAKSATAFGREYIAISDGLHGAEVPLQWDGSYLDRVTQDGPGTPPNVVSVALPSVAMASGGSVVLTLTESDPQNLVAGIFTLINTWTASSTSAANVGDAITIAGYTGTSIGLNGTWTITGIYTGGSGGYATLLTLSASVPSGTLPSTAAATGTVATSPMSRQDNVVTVNTATKHNLQVGYQALIAGVPATKFGSAGWSNGSSVTSITINNEALPGVATVTTSAAHGLTPGCFITLAGVTHVSVGSGISAISWAGGVATVTDVGHGLTPGSSVTISGTTNYNGTFTVAGVVSADVFVFLFVPISVPAAESTGSVYLNWPIPDTPDPTYFEVISAPTNTTFQVQVTYSDGTWTTGSIQFAWDGTFFVTAVPSTTQFQYQQYGPDANSSTTSGPTVTPWGQAAPGMHQCQVMFLTRQGYITRPSPPVKFIADGGQFISLSDIPIGPSNVAARILAFTGAKGAYFYYIPTPAQVNGRIVSSATQIDDNISTSAFLDFSDNTLFGALSISSPGNELANEIILDGALGFGYYASRLVTWGQRNRIQNLLNLTFDGGFTPTVSTPLTSPSGLGTTLDVTNGNAIANGVYILVDNEFMLVTSGGGTATLTVTRGLLGSVAVNHASGANVFVSPSPTGWKSPVGTFGGNLCIGHYGMGWSVTLTSTPGTYGFLSQANGMYQDCYGAPIAAPNTTYKLRCWLSSTSATGQVVAVIFSNSLGFTSYAAIPGIVTAGGFYEAVFTLPTPDTVPSDLQLAVYGNGSSCNLVIDEVSIIYADNPYTDAILYGSYVNNPEAFDGVSGKFGASEDSHKVLDFGIIRETLYFLTQEPSGRLHETSDNGVTEPVAWQTKELAANCGLLSAFALTKSQADDSSASGGEEWFAWASASGARIFGGDQPFKISQEIQPDWVGASASGANSWSSATGIVPAYNKTVWALNDPVARVMYFGLPTIEGGGSPDVIYTMNYRELDTASQIASANPIHTSLSGKLICTDHTRKWSPWRMTMNGAALMYRDPGKLETVFFGGNGRTPSTAAGYGNVYTLDSAKLTDDDYGQITPFYTTYFFLTREQESALSAMDAKGQRSPIGGGRKMISYLTAYISGVGSIKLVYLCNTLTNQWPLTTTRTLSLNPTIDLEGGGGMAISNRIAIQFLSYPITGTDNAFQLQKVLVGLKGAQHLPIRGSAQ